MPLARDHTSPNLALAAHCLTCGAFTPEGEFLEVPELDLERLQAAWRKPCSPSIWPRRRSSRKSSEHADLAAQRPQRRLVGVLVGRRAGGHQAFGPIHDPLSVQPLAAGESDGDWARDLQGREGRLPGLPRAAGEAWKNHRFAAQEVGPPGPALTLIRICCGATGWRRGSRPTSTGWPFCLLPVGGLPPELATTRGPPPAFGARRHAA